MKNFLLPLLLFSHLAMAENGVLGTRYSDQRNNEKYSEQKFQFNFKNQKEQSFNPEDIGNLPKSRFVKFNANRNVVQDDKRKFEISSFAGATGKKFSEKLYTEFNLGVKRFKYLNESKSHTTLVGGEKIVYDYSHKMSFGLRFNSDYLTYSSSIKSRSVTPTLLYVYSSEFSSLLQSTYSYLQDKNSKQEHSLELNYILNDEEPKIVAGFNFYYLSFDKDYEQKSGYWSPPKLYALGPKIEVVSPVTDNFDYTFYYSLNETKDYSASKKSIAPSWKFSDTALLGLWYTINSFKINLSYGISSSNRILGEPLYVNQLDNSVKNKGSQQIALGLFTIW